MITALIRGEEKVNRSWSSRCLAPRWTAEEAEAAALTQIRSCPRPPRHVLTDARLFCASGPLFAPPPLPPLAAH